MQRIDLLAPYRGTTAPNAPASLAAKMRIILLIAEECITDQERNTMILAINSFTQKRAEQAIENLQYRVKRHDRDNH
jgi:hypothetical protein